MMDLTMKRNTKTWLFQILRDVPVIFTLHNILLSENSQEQEWKETRVYY